MPRTSIAASHGPTRRIFMIRPTRERPRSTFRKPPAPLVPIRYVRHRARRRIAPTMPASNSSAAGTPRPLADPTSQLHPSPSCAVRPVDPEPPDDPELPEWPAMAPPVPIAPAVAPVPVAPVPATPPAPEE